MGVSELFWYAGQQIQINQAKQEAEEAKFDAQKGSEQAVQQAVLPYVQHLDKLSLICRAMWTLIEEKTDLTEDDLLHRVTELDMKDGVSDGRYTAPAAVCTKCGAKVCMKFGRCLFCGQEYAGASAFDTV